MSPAGEKILKVGLAGTRQVKSGLRLTDRLMLRFAGPTTFATVLLSAYFRLGRNGTDTDFVLSQICILAAISFLTYATLSLGIPDRP